ncbi:MAG: nucleotide pyrophosphohydrolase [Bdellovibrionales bacterium]|nr:nucleotide pyrophosphohydrolase [Bdellovibrionales bacterium]
MDTSATVEALKQKVQKFCEDRNWDQFHGPKDLAIGAVTESSELLEIFRFVKDQDCPKLLNDPKIRSDISDELADVLFFVLRFAQMNNFDLEQALAHKLQKNEAKYPVEKSYGKNTKYTHL